MGQPRAVLDCYDRIATLSAEMLEAARTGAWDRVATLEHDCSATIGELRALLAGVEFDRDQRDVRLAALRRILAADAEIRSIAEPQWARIGLASRGASAGGGSSH